MLSLGVNIQQRQVTFKVSLVVSLTNVFTTFKIAAVKLDGGLPGDDRMRLFATLASIPANSSDPPGSSNAIEI